MEKEVVWTSVAQQDFWQIVKYLDESWPKAVLERFQKSLAAKTSLLIKQPNAGFKSKKYSKYRRTLITRHYMLVYSVKRNHIVIHRLRHVNLK